MSVATVSSRLVLLAALAGGLAACQSSRSSDEPSTTERRITERVLFGGRPLPEQKEEVRDLGCPTASILDGTAAYRTGDTQQARGVAYQAAIFDIARECITQGNTMRIKVGVQGRVVLGEIGKPGTYTIPVRIAVRGNGQTLTSKLVQVPVNVPRQKARRRSSRWTTRSPCRSPRRIRPSNMRCWSASIRRAHANPQPVAPAGTDRPAIDGPCN